MRRACCRTRLPSHSWSMCQTKLHWDCHCTEAARSCRVRVIDSLFFRSITSSFRTSSAYENLAMRLVQCLYLTSPTMARVALKRENFEFNKLSTLEVASTSSICLTTYQSHSTVPLVISQSEDFVGHTSVQEVFDEIWSGQKTQKVMRYSLRWWWWRLSSVQIKGKHFDRMLASSASTFGHATTSIQ